MAYRKVTSLAVFIESAFVTSPAIAVKFGKQARDSILSYNLSKDARLHDSVLLIRKDQDDLRSDLPPSSTQYVYDENVELRSCTSSDTMPELPQGITTRE